ncbi:hypothetical protein F4827_001210 [Paraburkholderia bannensis]|uniref:Lipoprotein n=1 Tax=Paraburkholderia bannensis TaxID=765414 RepID=A0A7W9TVD5_9BURK|nr:MULTISPECIES: hypothetical protein [Paraburkholderia]MBB3256377.1 hypothetical protein [Paraburkholderia sp. WP4_3_2]MBB6101376.1 hypothetical protein [Paraburkholderia bannensis]
MKSPFHVNALRRPFHWAASAGAAGALLALGGCYYYTPYGYSPYPAYYYATVPASSTQQQSAVAVAGSNTGAYANPPSSRPNPAPAAVADAQYPGPLYPSPPVAVAVPAWPAYPAYYSWPAYYAYPASYPGYYGYSGWGWGAPAVSLSVGFWGGGYWGRGGYWGHGGYWGRGYGGYGGHWHR